MTIVYNGDIATGDSFTFNRNNIEPSYALFKERMKQSFDQRVAESKGDPQPLQPEELIKLTSQVLGEIGGIENWEALLETSKDWQDFCKFSADEFLQLNIQEQIIQRAIRGL